MSGETLQDYFRRLNLDENRKKYLENIKEGKQVDMTTEEQYFNGIAEQHSLIAVDGYSTYMKRFLIHRYMNLARTTSYTWNYPR